VRVVRNSAIDASRSQVRRRDRETRAVKEGLLWLEPVDVTALDPPSSEEIQAAIFEICAAFAFCGSVCVGAVVRSAVLRCFDVGIDLD
jgi:hypothetical protein